MPDYRRTAREMALRVLYEADVGHQAVRDAIAGALDQLAAGVCSGLTMACRQAERRMSKSPDPPLTIVSQVVRRERARVRRNAERQLQAIAAALAAEIAEVLQLRPTRTVEEVLASFDEVAKPPMDRLARTLAGSSLPRSELAEYEAAARDAVRAMRTTLEKRLPTARATADMLVRLAAGTSRNHEALDDRLRPFANDWPLDRQPCADRNILRLAAYEMLHCPETPPAVVMNEAVELAKRYGTEESARFINGVLSALAVQEGIISLGASG